MNNALLHNELSVSFPEGFHVMDRDEMKKLYLDDNPNRWGIWDTERHIIITVFWHQTNGILAALADEKSVAQSTESRLSRGLKKYHYKCLGFFSTPLCGQEVPGFRYEYTLGDVVQVGETILLKQGKTCYTIYYYERKNRSYSDHEVFEEVLRSIAIR